MSDELINPANALGRLPDEGLEDAAAIERQVAYDEIRNPEDAAEIKRLAAEVEGGGSWRADLWGNVPQAINWANTIPVSQPGTIIFNIRDNGQVWTYTFL